jgi:hypothetical protein
LFCFPTFGKFFKFLFLLAMSFVLCLPQALSPFSSMKVYILSHPAT